MDKTTACGIGDLIVWKWYEINKGDAFKRFNFSLSSIRTHRSDVLSTINTIKYIVSKLFPYAEFHFFENDDPEFKTKGSIEYPSAVPLKTINLYRLFSNPKFTPSLEKYIVFQTKARFRSF